MSEFDKHWNEWAIASNCPEDEAKIHFEAGQQSKQAEIDVLKSKIEEIEKWAEFHIEDYNLSESDSEHDRSWFNAACQVFKSLKRDQK